MTRLEALHPRPNLGGHATESEALKEMVDLLVESLRPRAIYLFGSRARGTARLDSDFDLMVVIPSEHGDDAVDYDRVYAPLRKSMVGCDVVPVSEEGFAEDRDDPTSLCFEAHHHGRLLYERS